MTTDNDTAIFKAVQAIGEALKPLSPDDRQKALNGVSAILGINLTTGNPPPGDPPPPPEKDSGTGGGQSRKKLSVAEFVDKCGPSTNPERIAAFAAYRQDVEGNEHFSRGDLKQYFAMAKIAVPKNYDRDFTNAVAGKYIHEDGDKSYLTKTGENAVSEGFQKKSSVKASRGGKRVSRKKSA